MYIINKNHVQLIIIEEMSSQKWKNKTKANSATLDKELRLNTLNIIHFLVFNILFYRV